MSLISLLKELLKFQKSFIIKKENIDLQLFLIDLDIFLLILTLKLEKSTLTALVEPLILSHFAITNATINLQETDQSCSMSTSLAITNFVIASNPPMHLSAMALISSSAKISLEATSENSEWPADLVFLPL